MGDDWNGVTSVMTEGYEYFSQVKCVNCGKESIHNYGPDMEFEKCPHCRYAWGIRDKPIEKQTTMGDFL